MMKKVYFNCLFFFCLIQVSGQQHANMHAGEILQGIKKLNVLGSVLYVAAHPDDENTRLIAYLANEKLYRTGYLSMTRGDGGQNLIGDEQGIELGLIRTQELLAARRIDGGEQFFSRAYDFGYSKNPDETFEKWNKEKILSDVVWVIRKFQPDVIITRFPSTGEGGHGHHTASAILANDAFAAAADPKRFPEQLQYVKPWQVKRVLWNTFNFGSTNTTREDQFKIDVGGYNSFLGKSYGEISAQSRSQHKSQGFGVPSSRGTTYEYFAATKGLEPKQDLMDGVDLSWNKIKGAEPIQKMVDKIADEFNMQHPENSVKALLHLYKTVQQLPDSYWRNDKLIEIKNLIAACNGLYLEASTSKPFAVQTDSLSIQFSIINRSGISTELQSVKINDAIFSSSRVLTKNDNVNFSGTYFINENIPLSQPYWLQEGMDIGSFHVSSQQKIGQPDADPAIKVQFVVKIEGVDFDWEIPVMYKYTDPVKGEIFQPLSVIPPVTLFNSPSLLLFSNYKSETKNLAIQVNGHKNISQPIEINLLGEEKKSVKDASGVKEDIHRTYQFQIPHEATTQKSGTNGEKVKEKSDQSGISKIFTDVTFPGTKDEKIYNKAIREINYDHIPVIRYFYSDYVNAIKLDLRTLGQKIGYIAGAGDKVPDALEQMGYQVTMLNQDMVEHNNLSVYDAIITGIRAYNVHDWLESSYDKLMKYVFDGGNLIVQYNTSSRIGPLRSKMGPYSFDIARTRVTDENAEVNFVKPNHHLLNFPNKISKADFEGWIQERSIYHAANWDIKYETVISMHDPGENNDEGALITGRYGKGCFTYTGLVFFRELPMGVPGAYRLLANIIAQHERVGINSPDLLPPGKKIIADKKEKKINENK